MKKEEKSRKIIGILGVPSYDDENDSTIALYTHYKNAVVSKNCIPFMICPLADIDYWNTPSKEIPDLTEEEKNFYRDIVDLCDGIIIPGGYRWYNFDEFITEYAIEKDIPVFGICMGMQLLATLDNNEDCLKLIESTIEHRQRDKDYVHSVNIVNDSFLKKIINKDQIKVNSKHRYHVCKVNKFKISAYSEDGIIEAIELPNKKFVIGVQWHPEKMINYDDAANKLFDRFISCCDEK